LASAEWCPGAEVGAQSCFAVGGLALPSRLELEVARKGFDRGRYL
jgi:hypothetical protein